jgi:hypothetical protein
MTTIFLHQLIRQFGFPLDRSAVFLVYDFEIRFPTLGIVGVYDMQCNEAVVKFETMEE